jgi:hypothetical protein
MRKHQFNVHGRLKGRRSAIILGWDEPFAARVLERLHEYDDRRTKVRRAGTVVSLEFARAAPGRSQAGGNQ